MRRAPRAAGKVAARCPHCGSRRPKEVAEDGRRFNATAWLLFSLWTCGLGLPFFFLFYSPRTSAWCPDCEGYFDP